MKCRYCKNEINDKATFCPHCGIEFDNAILESYKTIGKIRIFISNIRIIGVVILFLLILLFVLVLIPYSKQKNKEYKIDDVASELCKGDYSIVYQTPKYPNQIIYECQKDNYIYAINKKDNTDNVSIGLYDFGVTYNEYIEMYFPNGIYLYRETEINNVNNEIKIAVEAKSTTELINNYSNKFYELIHNYKANNENIELSIYYNETLSGIKNTYDKLFLFTSLNNNIVKKDLISDRKTKYLYQPKKLLNSIFENPENYPSDAKKALFYNQNVKLTIKNPNNLTIEKFKKELVNLYK